MPSYAPRNKSDLSPVARMLSTEGIAQVAPIYPPEVLQHINTRMDPIFAAQTAKARAYVTVDDMIRLDLLDTLLGGNMRNLLLSIIPDPVLYHCHAYEIAANSPKAHIFSESIAGWHRDEDSEYFKDDPTHTSVFVYLSDVGPQDGAFEFSPTVPTHWVRSTTPAISVTGPAGFSFAWNRAFYHRASPNFGAVRRRLIKLSVQPNSFISAHLSNTNFTAAKKALPAGEPYLDLLFGRYQGGAPPTVAAPDKVIPIPIPSTGTINISNDQLAKAQLRQKAWAARSRLRRWVAGENAPAAAYD